MNARAWVLRSGDRPGCDAAALARLHQRCFARRGRAWSEAAFNALMGGSGQCWAEATADDGSQERARLLGFAVARVIKDEAELLTLCRDPNWAGHSLGSSLLRRVFDDVRTLGATSMFLEVAAGNQSALSLYASVGFQEVGRRRRYYRRTDGDPEDALVLRTHIANP